MKNTETDYVDYIILVPGKSFSKDFLASWTNTISYMYENNYTYKFVVAYNPVVSAVRNMLLSSQIHDGLKVTKVNDINPSIEIFAGSFECKKVIFIDSDMVWTKEDIDKLIKSPYDVTTGIYTLSDNHSLSIMKKDSEGFMLKSELQKMKKPFPIKASGMGFVACTYEILKKLEYPWFFTIDDVQIIDGKKYQYTVGEDAFFFIKLSMLEGNPSIMADPSIRLGHQKETIYTL